LKKPLRKHWDFREFRDIPSETIENLGMSGEYRKMIYRFADCVLDTDRHRFTRSGEPVDLEPQVFDLLTLLAENAGRLVTKDQMIDRVWGGRIVSEATISSRISVARAAVGDTGKDQQTIKTIARRGIELIAPVAGDNAPVARDTWPAIRKKGKSRKRFGSQRRKMVQTLTMACRAKVRS
jgi:DNA-binding winged helix-turn-helix (wHTH) protein